MEIGKRLAIRLLRGLRFGVEEIPVVGDDRRADLRVTDHKDTYHIEVKDKLESPERVKERTEVLMRGDFYEPPPDPLAYNNTIMGILRGARDQLDRTPKTPNTFQLIWFYFDGVDADTKYRQAMATFYGQVNLSALHPNRNKSTWCFYLDYNAAFEMPTVDALILQDRESLQVCLNDFALRTAEFRSTQFCREFHMRGHIFDPIELEGTGDLITYRGHIPRKRQNEATILKEIREQTGVTYITNQLNRYTFYGGWLPGQD
jgi:hypothetical protein